MSPKLFILMSTLSCLVAVGALASCGGGGGGSGSVTAPPAQPPLPPPPPPPPSPPPPSTSIERDISPLATDPTLTNHLAVHFAVTPNPQTSADNRLFIMLPGTGAEPRFYREIVRTGAAAGYHAIGLGYPNAISVFDLCEGDLDPDCAGKVRREVITGQGFSPLVSVSESQSIVGRLTSLLTYLDVTYPSEGWGQYLFSGAPNWNRITVAGHSQGSGHAAYLGRLQSLDRIVMLSGPSDIGLTAASPALWFSQPSITPSSRYFGFTHAADDLVPLALVARNWAALGLSEAGPQTSVDGAAPPYGRSQQLVTSAPPNPNPIGPTPSPTHASPVVDAYTPIDAEGRPVYRAVWTYLAFQ